MPLSPKNSVTSLSAALTGPSEESLRRKGEQRGSVSRRGGSWHITFSAWVSDGKDGIAYKPIMRRVGPAKGPEAISKREAQRIGLEKFVMPANGPAHCPQGQATLAQFVETRFRPDHINVALKKTGKEYYESILRRHIIPSLGSIRLAEISTSMIQTLISAKRDSGLAPGTLRHIRNCISAIFRHARALKFYHGELPTENVKLPKMTETSPGALTADQVRLLIENVPTEYRWLLTVMSQTGLRIGEALGLRWKHVNLEDNWKIEGTYAIAPTSLLVCENWVRGERTTLKTDKSRRPIPLTAAAWVALTLQREASKWFGDEHPVFASRSGTPLDGHNIAKRYLKKAGRAIGVPSVSFHWLRHTASTATDSFLTAAQKRALLGHTTDAMGGRYTHPDLESLRIAMEKANDTKVIH